MSVHSEPCARRSERSIKLTWKAQELRNDEVIILTKQLNTNYQKWKEIAANARREIKTSQSLEGLMNVQRELENKVKTVVDIYDKLKKISTPPKDIVQRVDNCTLLSGELLDMLMAKRIDDPEDFSSKTRELKHTHPSIFGDSESVLSSHRPSTLLSETSITSLKAKADADLAEKVERFKSLQSERPQKIKMLELQSQMEDEKLRLECLQAQSEIKAAEARSKVLKEALEGESRLQDFCEQTVLNPEAPIFKPQHESNELIRSLITMNRLPPPKPTVFSGDPLKFLEWKNSFYALIENKGLNNSEKFYYLKEYIAGPAKRAIEGFFHQDPNNAYTAAWQVLNERFGDPFILKRAFREKISNWKRIGANDPYGLRDFCDFLNAVSSAMTYIPGLEVLNDCEENRKILLKLPDWLVQRWNRTVVGHMERSKEYPDFHVFVHFIKAEAKIICNPISSPHFLRSSDDKTIIKETRRCLASNLAEDASELKSRNQDTDTDKPRICMYCKCEGHGLASCFKFASKDMPTKRHFIKNNHLCFGCLVKGHVSSECRRRHVCKTCKRKHPTCLHMVYTETSNEANKTREKEEKETLSCAVNRLHISSSIVPVWLSHAEEPGKECLVYALLDTQSDTTFLLKEVGDRWKSKATPVTLKLSTMTSSGSVESSKRLDNLQVRGMNSEIRIPLPHVYTRDYIPVNRTHIPTCDTAKNWPHLKHIANEIPSLQVCDIALLIGYDCPQALTPREVISGQESQPFAQRTDLGWSVIGQSNIAIDRQAGLCHRILTKEYPAVQPRDLIKALEADFADMEYATEKKVSQDDISFINMMSEQVQQRDDRYIQMPLPFKSRPHLPNNKQLARTRLDHLKRKLDNNSELKENYIKFMHSMLIDGDAQRVTDMPKDGATYYIPHHGVYNAKKAKLRVVFDCSAKFKGVSLNDHLLSGPDLINSLLGIWCRFRKHQIAITCDIEKMFHRFRVKKEDRDYLRFLWWEDGDTRKEPQDYRMNVHLFGAKSSPGCANYGLKHLATLHEDEFPLAAHFIKQEFYVDDGVTSVETEEEAIQLVAEARKICSRGNLRLHKFISNSRKVLESIPSTERAKHFEKVNLHSDSLPTERTLGIQWNIETDKITYQVQIKPQINTRRTVLSLVSSVYDPLGFVAPVILLGKSILQQTCKQGVSWDEKISDQLLSKWEIWKADLTNLQQIEICRCYKPAEFINVTRVELHHFADASTEGYGACSYLRFLNESNVHCSLVLAKARVSPVKIVSIPRLELTAAVVAVKLSIKLREVLQMNIDQEFYWTDSKVVLGYICNEVKRFHVFVANRAQFIIKHTDKKQWYHVSTDNNPADHASRGRSVKELLNSNWFTGPEFLWKLNSPITPQDYSTELSNEDPEIKVHTFFTHSLSDLSETLQRFSNWNLLVRVISRIQRLARHTTSSEPITAKEIMQARLAVVQLVQRISFNKEFQQLTENKTLPANNDLHQLNPYIEDGVIRVGGRLEKSSFDLNVKHPVLLPKTGHVTQLIIAHYHKEVHHQGRGQTLTAIRMNGYWIIGGSKVVATFIRNCVQCRKLRRPTEEQKMSPLPKTRVEPSPPFSYCGMDCFGPFVTKQNRKEHKRYGLLFTCFCSRAVHIEMIEDLSSDAFINALRCFIAIRGAVTEIISDRGSNFIGAKNEFSIAMKEMNTTAISNFLSKRQCNFKFHVPYASHTGGVWERQIRSIRNVLKLTTNNSRLDDASLRTLFYEAMMIVNSRPLVQLSSDPGIEPITPNHLITMKSTIPQPTPGNFVKEDLYARKRWRRVQYLTEQFWNKWRNEYVLNQTQRQKWFTPRRNVRPGDVVLLTYPCTARTEWPLGIVIEAEPDQDGLVRRVKVRMSTAKLNKLGQRDKDQSVLERPVQKIVVILEKM